MGKKVTNRVFSITPSSLLLRTLNETYLAYISVSTILPLSKWMKWSVYMGSLCIGYLEIPWSWCNELCILVFDNSSISARFCSGLILVECEK